MEPSEHTTTTTITTVADLKDKMAALRARGFIYTVFDRDDIYEWFGEMTEDWACVVTEDNWKSNLTFTFDTRRTIEFKLKFL